MFKLTPALPAVTKKAFHICQMEGSAVPMSIMLDCFYSLIVTLNGTAFSHIWGYSNKMSNEVMRCAMSFLKIIKTCTFKMLSFEGVRCTSIIKLKSRMFYCIEVILCYYI